LNWRSAGSPNSSVSAIQELARERVGAIIGPMTDVEAAAREAQKQSVPLITLTQKQDITAVGSYVFRHFITPQNQVASLVDYLIGHLGLRTFAVLYPKETYGQTFKDLFWDAVVKRGGQMTALQTYDPRQTDFTDTIKNLVKAGQDHARQSGLQNEVTNPSMEVQDPAQAPGLPAEGAALAAPEEAGVGFEALFIPDSTQKAALILPQLATYDVGGLTLAGTNLWHSEKLLPLSGAFDGRIVVADGFFKDSRLPAARHFVHEYRAIYNQDPGLIEALAFDTANFLFGVMGRPDIRWRNSLLSAMKQQTMNEGASGPLFFDEFGEAQKTLFLLRIQDGRFVEADDL
jgi:ABC-type branched-subunit amino acid transport system substrate-binding protein